MRQYESQRTTVFEIEFFALLSEEDRTRLIESSEIVTFDAGQNLIFRNELCPGLILLVAGSVRSCAASDAGKAQTFHVLEAGDVFGLFGVVGQTKVPCELSAASAGSILVIPFDEIRRIMRRDHQFALFLFERSCEQGEIHRQLAESLSLQDALGRLASWLLARYAGSRAGEGALAGVTQAQIAAELGTVREVVSRGLARLERDGLIATEGKDLAILKPERLAQLAAYLPTQPVN